MGARHCILETPKLHIAAFLPCIIIKSAVLLVNTCMHACTIIGYAISHTPVFPIMRAILFTIRISFINFSNKYNIKFCLVTSSSIYSQFWASSTCTMNCSTLSPLAGYILKKIFYCYRTIRSHLTMPTIIKSSQLVYKAS